MDGMPFEVFTKSFDSVGVANYKLWRSHLGAQSRFRALQWQYEVTKMYKRKYKHIKAQS